MQANSHALRLWRALSAVKVDDADLLNSRLTWYHEGKCAYDPPFAQFLEDFEIDLIASWFAETTDAPFIGDSGFVAASFVADLILTNRAKSVIQLGHYAGFGSLIIGMMLRKVSSDARLISFDIDDSMTKYSQQWIERAGLSEIVKNVCVDSTDPITLEMAGVHLKHTPDLIFIDASKQYKNTIREVNAWREYTHGYIVAHDVSEVAKSDQANGSLGVDDGLRDSRAFGENELLIIDPATERRPGFPYLDPCGLGIGIARGIKPLPRSNASLDELASRRAILPAAKLEDSENWFLQEGFEFQPGKLIKRAGREAWANCFAPVKSGQRLTCQVSLQSTNEHGVMICSGGNPGTTFWVRDTGTHSGEIVVGQENSLVGIYGSADTEFVIESILVTSSGEMDSPRPLEVESN